MNLFPTFILLCALSWTPAAFADTIQLKSGQSIQGVIVERNDKKIIIDSGVGVPVTYYTDEILSVQEDKALKPADSDRKKKYQQQQQIEARTAQADRLETQGLEKIDSGSMSDGLDLMRQAIELDPKPNRRMNYGSILFGNAISLSKSGKSAEAMPVFKQAEAELTAAVEQFDPTYETVMISQGFKQLGDLYLNAYGDKVKAKSFYEKALTYYDDPTAKGALDKLNLSH